jgi:hypothetical protein
MAPAWLARLLFAGAINGFGLPKPEQNHRRPSAGLGRWIAGTCIGVGALFCPSAHAQELNDVALLFLKLHRVPCLTVVKVGTVIQDEVVTCEDGREWMLFWLENEVAFVSPETHELYKWQWELNELYPQLYNASPRDSGGAKRFVTSAASGHMTTPQSP